MNLVLVALAAALVVFTTVSLLRSAPPEKKKGKRRKRVSYPEREERQREVDPAHVSATRELLAATMAIGTFAAEAVVRDRYPEAERLHPREGAIAHRFWSQLYRAGDIYVVVETLAGDAKLGWRTESDGTFEQGASNYLARVVLYGELAGDEHVAAVKRALAEKRVVYLQVRVPIQIVDGKSSASTIHVAEFVT
ncbi:MAG: hypothetical protein ACXWUG_19645 [Polyangiales bacterium]